MTNTILWFHQYSLNTNSHRFRCKVDPQNLMFIEVHFLLTFCIKLIGSLTTKLCILETDFRSIHEN